MIQVLQEFGKRLENLQLVNGALIDEHTREIGHRVHGAIHIGRKTGRHRWIPRGGIKRKIRVFIVGGAYLGHHGIVDYLQDDHRHREHTKRYVEHDEHHRNAYVRVVRVHSGSMVFYLGGHVLERNGRDGVGARASRYNQMRVKVVDRARSYGRLL